MYERFTDRARKTMQLANQEAQRFNHEYIGTEHILLGLARCPGGVAQQVIKSFRIDLRKIRLEVEKLVVSGPEMVTMGKLPQTKSAKSVVEFAMSESRSLKDDYLGTEHLLLGLLREPEGVAAKVLSSLDLEVSRVRTRTVELLESGISDQEEGLPRSRRTPTIELFGTLIDPTENCMAVSHEEFLGRIEVCLAQHRCQHVVLVSSSLTQPRSLVETLSYRLATVGDHRFHPREIIDIDLRRQLSSGRFAERLSALQQEAEKNINKLLFFERIDRLLLDPLISNDLAYAVKIFLDTLTVPIIVTTTPEGATQLNETIALQHVIEMPDVTRDAAHEILRTTAARNFDLVTFDDEVFDFVVKLSEEYVQLPLPDAGLMVIDRATAIAIVKAKRTSEVTSQFQKCIEKVESEISRSEWRNSLDRVSGLQTKLSRFRKDAMRALERQTENVTVSKAEVIQAVAELSGAPQDLIEAKIA